MSMSTLRLAAVALALLANAPAHASYGNVRAEINDIKLELIDLDLNDGITPSLQWTSNVWSLDLSTFDDLVRDSPGSWELSYAYGGASGTLGEHAIRGAAWFAPSPVGTVHWNSSSVNRTAGFTLTPSTGLRVTGQGYLELDHDYADRYTTSIWSRLTLTQPVNGLTRTSQVNQGFSLYRNDSEEYDLSLYLESGSQGANGELYLGTWSTIDDVSTVPEPATYGMLLAGALLVGAAARRRH